MKTHPTITAALLQAIKQSGQSLYRIGNASGVNTAILGRFVSGKQSLRLDNADKLAAHLGGRLVFDKKSKGR